LTRSQQEGRPESWAERRLESWPETRSESWPAIAGKHLQKVVFPYCPKEKVLAPERMVYT
jgi:hypothetical protein